MTPTNLTANKDLCQEFHELCKEKGIEVPETYFWWAEYRHKINQPDFKWEVTDSTYEGDYCEYKNTIPAPTSGELGVWLPKHSVTKEATLSTYNYPPENQTIQHVVWIPTMKEQFVADTEQDARLKMLLFLIREGYVTTL